MVKVALILGSAVAISGIQLPRWSLTRDFPVALLIPVITLVLLLDGELSRIDGCLLIGMFTAWLITVIIEARKQQSSADKILGSSAKCWRQCLALLALPS